MPGGAIGFLYVSQCTFVPDANLGLAAGRTMKPTEFEALAGVTSHKSWCAFRRLRMFFRLMLMVASAHAGCCQQEVSDWFTISVLLMFLLNVELLFFFSVCVIYHMSLHWRLCWLSSCCYRFAGSKRCE